MIVNKAVLTAATIAAFVTANLATSEPVRANDAAVAAGAFGLVGGMILGGALAQQNDERVVVRRRPVRVYEEDEVYAPPRCWREEWRDRWGEIHFRRICR